ASFPSRASSRARRRIACGGPGPRRGSCAGARSGRARSPDHSRARLRPASCWAARRPAPRTHWAGGHAAGATSGGARAARPAVARLEAHANRDSTILVDDTIWTDLVDRGFARQRTVWFYKLDLDPAVRIPWQRFDYIVRSNILAGNLDRLPKTRQVYDHSRLVVRFTSNDETNEIRRVVVASPHVHHPGPSTPGRRRFPPAEGGARASPLGGPAGAPSGRLARGLHHPFRKPVGQRDAPAIPRPEVRRVGGQAADEGLRPLRALRERSIEEVVDLTTDEGHGDVAVPLLARGERTRLTR